MLQPRLCYIVAKTEAPPPPPGVGGREEDNSKIGASSGVGAQGAHAGASTNDGEWLVIDKAFSNGRITLFGK